MVTGGSWIGPGVSVGPGCVIDGSILMAGARVGDAVIARRCAIGRGSQVTGPVTLQGNAIGDDAVVGAGYRPRAGERIPTAAVLPCERVR